MSHPTLESEHWLPVAGHEGRYEVSNLGQVRRVRDGYVLRPHRTRRGYLTVALYRDGRHRTHSVSRLVALTFVPGYAPGLTVDHMDDSTDNDRADNLQWLDRAANLRRTQVGKPKNRGSKSGMARLTEGTVAEARRRFSAGEATPAELATEYGVALGTMYSALTGKTWGHVPGAVPKRRQTGRWTADYDACTECGTTDRPHSGRGLCGRCDSRLRFRRSHGVVRPRVNFPAKPGGA